MWRALKANALGGLKRHWQDLVIVTCLVLLSLWVRRLTLAEIEGGGDAVRKWFFVKQWSHATSMSEIAWNHHLARMGINVWAFIAQKLIGRTGGIAETAMHAATDESGGGGGVGGIGCAWWKLCLHYSSSYSRPGLKMPAGSNSCFSRP